ncbi:hypothetical protein Pmani_014393 [Petrolisthes manimaculis]|uniref:Uncharacterized protein n=1 Tax=Petrolisthes manimaculis TaxID=1843537 RepID=A0AAE1PT04_9EUCA|nr:hypothetical protein Pmani_014393 [Petrolisthes manimaculis]
MKGSRSTSAVWTYFTCVSREVAQCSLCSRNYSRKGRGTTSLKSHLRSKHKNQYRAMLDLEDQRMKWMEEIALKEASYAPPPPSIQAADSATIKVEAWDVDEVPDLVDRVPGTSSSKDHDDDPDHDQDSQVIMDHQDPHHIDLDERKGTNKSFHPPQTHHSDVGEEDPLADHQRQSPSPTHSNTGNIAGLVGPYLLKKETHCTTVLDQLMRDDTFTDVTLTAQGQSLRAHRIVLCLASSYFRQVLSRDMGVQSVIVLRDIKFAELRNIIHFIYTGEATVDASELESFMKTAELLEISSLCEGQKCITGRSHSSSSSNNTTNTNNHSSSFSVGDFERLVGTKRPRKDTSPTSARIKTRRHSGDGGSSRCSSTEPPATPTLTLVKEEPDCDITETFTPIITSVASGSSKIVASDTKFLESDNQTTTGGGGGGEEQTSEATGSSKRSRRDSTGSVGGFAAIAGVQQKMVCEEEGDDDPGEVFSPPPVTSPSSSQAGPPHTTHTPDLTPADTTAVPGRCPYCPHISHKFEGLTMMRHLLVSHPCKPAFPCSTCWRVFVKRVAFKAHQQICQQQQLGS